MISTHDGTLSKPFRVEYMKEETMCQDHRPLYPFPASGGEHKREGNFTLTSSLKFSINLYRR